MSNTPAILPSAEPLVFIPECLPQLAAGEYQVVASLTVTAGKAADFAPAEKNFWVSAPRFILDSSAIYTMYPPAGITGRFESTLPHVVFNRRTLPWERTIDGETHEKTKFKSTDATTHAPWMALIILSEEEMKGSGVASDAVFLKKATIQDLGDDVFVPEIDKNVVNGQNPKLAPWEKVDAEYSVIDIPLPLFKQVMPACNDLPFLAHVRKVLVDKNKESADIGDDGYFSTLICNRLPSRAAAEKMAMKNTVFLVSLEGFQNYYQHPSYIESKRKKKVRMAVLHSWSFTVAAGKNFMELCQGLRVSPFKMNYPEHADETLKKAYDYGYTLLPQTTRDGLRTFCWYRGPFNPNFIPANPRTSIFKTADAALRFDHTTGLVDVSYAAAWQLGRMLALKDKAFCNALYQWKIQSKRNVVDEASLQQIRSMLPGVDNLNDCDTFQKLEDYTRDFLNKHYSPDAGMDKKPATVKNTPGDHQRLLDEIAVANNVKAEVPSVVTDWLGNLFLLNGVPVNYLIPHEDYLVSRTGDEKLNEAIGTFYIDYDWLEALLGGALSIVASEDSIALLNRLKDGSFLPSNLVVNKAQDGSVAIDVDGNTQGIKNHITGFLLRSQLISGWKGIKIFARNEADDFMQEPLRIERVADDTQLCFFSGKVQKLSFIQPPEGVHFGVDIVKENLEKRLRNENGNIVEAKVKVSSDKGVLALEKLAEDFTKAGAPVQSSAQFAYQMLEAPVIYLLNIDDYSKS